MHQWRGMGLKVSRRFTGAHHCDAQLAGTLPGGWWVSD